MKEVRNQNDLMDVITSENAIFTFYNNWCPICKMVYSALEQYAYYHPDLLIARLNITDHPDLARQLSVVNVPITFIYKDDTLYEKIQGMVDLEYLDDIFYSMGNDFE